MPAEFVDQNAGGSSGGAAAELPVRTVVRSATQTRALPGRGTPRRRLARMMACGMMMVMMMLTGTSTKCVNVVPPLTCPLHIGRHSSTQTGPCARANNSAIASGQCRRGLVTALNRANWALCQASTARASVVCCAYIRSQQPSPLTAHSSQQPWPVHGVQVPINQAQRLATSLSRGEAVSTEAPADGSRFSTRTRRRPRKKRQPPPPRFQIANK
jgi:hypothetical protein